MGIKAYGKRKNNVQKYRVRIRYKDSNNEYKELNRIATSYEEAKNIEYELTKLAKEKSQLRHENITLNQLFEGYIELKKQETRESTWEKSSRNIQRYILPFLGEYQVSKLSIHELQQWKLEIGGRPLSIVTKRNLYGEFRALLNHAVRMEYIPSNLLLKLGTFKETLAIQKEMDFYTPDEFKQFIEVAKQDAIQYEQKHNSVYNWNYYVFFNIAFYCGFRKGEIHGLRWSDIDGINISVKRSINQKLRKDEDVETAPKNRSSIRTIQMPQQLIAILNEHKERQSKLYTDIENRRILGDNRCVRDSTICKKNAEYAKTAGIKKIRIHDFRHSHASLLANNGINIQEIARRLGHSNVQETWNTYSHLYPQEAEKALKVLEAI